MTDQLEVAAIAGTTGITVAEKDHLAFKKLDYEVISDAQIVKQRRQVTFMADRAGDYDATATSAPTITFSVSSSNEYIYGPTSYLAFDLTATAAGTYAATSATLCQETRNASALRCFKTAIINAGASGSIEIERLDDLDLLSEVQDKFSTCRDFETSTGATYWCGVTNSHTSTFTNTITNSQLATAAAAGTGATANNAVTPAIGTVATNIDKAYDTTDFSSAATARRTACIPLSHIAGIFAMTEFIPTPDMGGFKLTLECNLPKRAFFQSGGGTYKIEKPRLVLDCYRLADDIRALTSKMAADGSLILHYTTWMRNLQNITAGTTTVSISRGLSKCLMAFSKPIPIAWYDGADGKDAASSAMTQSASGAGNSVTFEAYQYQVGTQLYPLREVTTTVEAYCEALRAWNLLGTVAGQHPAVYLKDFGKTNSSLNASPDLIFAVDLERNCSERYATGESLNNSNQLRFNLRTTQIPVDTYLLTFVNFARLLVIGQNRQIIRE